MKSVMGLFLMMTVVVFFTTSNVLGAEKEDKSNISIRFAPAVVTQNGVAMQPLNIEISDVKESGKGKIYINGKLSKSITLKAGNNFFTILQPAVAENKSGKKIKIKVETPESTKTEEILVKQPKHWRVNFVQHTHTDIGYTRPQIEILGEHMRYIDYALDYCDATDHLPEEAQFRWTCEISWAVDQFLKSRPADQIDRLKKRIKEGRIEVGAMYLNFDELPDEQTLAQSLSPFKRFKEHGIESKVALQNDVNGIAWCMNDFYQNMGVKYLDMGTHGHRALICFDKPTCFWWESPSGNRMLAYRAEHYHQGNFIAFHEDDFEKFEKKFLEYLGDLGDKEYPFDITSIQYSGYHTDNSPPNPNVSKMVMKWNDKYEWPKIKNAITAEFFEEIEEKYADKLDVYRGAWPDWWTDGFGSGAREVASTRNAHIDIIAAQGLMSMAKMMGANMPVNAESSIFNINNSILFYDEHTFGYSESIRDPYSQQSMEQRELKESYAWESFRNARLLKEEAMGVMQQFIVREDVPTVTIFNTMNWNRDGLVKVYAENHIIPKDREVKLVDENGKEGKFQIIKGRNDGNYWVIWAEDVPAMGQKKYRIEATDRKIERPEFEETSKVDFENQWYKLKVNKDKGTISSLFDKDMSKELLDKESEWELGEFIYELANGNRRQMEQKKFDEFTRDALNQVKFEGYKKGDVWNSILFVGNNDNAMYGPDGFKLEVRIYNTSKRIDFAYYICKKPILDPESVYVAFPFKLEDGKIFADVQGGVMEVGVQQIPGSSSDWNTIQNFAEVTNGNEQITLGCNEAPLMMFGGLNMGRFEAGVSPESNQIFGWPMNNYWVTNFNADQRGGFDWTYYFTSGKKKEGDNSRFGWSSRVPMPARVMQEGEGASKEIKSVIDGIPANVLLVNAKPFENKNQIVLQLREIEGKSCNLNISSSYKNLNIEEVNAIDEPVKDGALSLKPYESKFIKLSW